MKAYISTAKSPMNLYTYIYILHDVYMYGTYMYGTYVYGTYVFFYMSATFFYHSWLVGWLNNIIEGVYIPINKDSLLRE